MAPMSLPSLDGGLAAYIRRVNAAPMLTEEEERRLALSYRSSGDVSAARELAVSHLRLVVALARKYSGYGLDQGDLIQEGNIGLLKAVQRFNPDMGARLATFAAYWIRAQMHEFIMANWRIVKIATTKAQRKLFFHLGRVLKKGALGGGDAESDEDIARDLSVAPDDVREMRARAHNTILARDENGDMIEPVADASSDPERQLIERDERERRLAALSGALEMLDSRSREILRERKLAERAAPLRELAERYGVSMERVRQIEARALKKVGDELRARLA